MGLKAFTLEVRISNKNAISLYEKCGFENAGIRKNFYDNPKEDAMIMWLYL
jgi:ribosomal-protein-alanine N-acetyltransferase